MRRGFDGLASQVQQHLGHDLFNGQFFVFRGRRGDLIKIICWEGQDGHKLAAYEAKPSGALRGGLVLGRGIELMQRVSFDSALADIAAAWAALGAAKTDVIGFCWGGTLSWISATRPQGFSAAAIYYGGGIGNVASEDPNCSEVAHFGADDEPIPVSSAEEMSRLHPAMVELHIYPARHGFNCDQRCSYDVPSAKLARKRTLEFFAKHIGPDRLRPAGVTARRQPCSSRVRGPQSSPLISPKTPPARLPH